MTQPSFDLNVVPPATSLDPAKPDVWGQALNGALVKLRVATAGLVDWVASKFDPADGQLRAAAIPFGVLPGEVAEGSHAHRLRVFNRAGQLLPAPLTELGAAGDAEWVRDAAGRAVLTVPSVAARFPRLSGYPTLSKSTTLQVIGAGSEELSFTAVPGGTYHVSFCVEYNSPDGAALRFGLMVTGAAIPPGTTTAGMVLGFQPSPVGNALPKIGSIAGITWNDTFGGFPDNIRSVTGNFALFVGSTGQPIKVALGVALAAASTSDKPLVMRAGTHLASTRVG